MVGKQSESRHKPRLKAARKKLAAQRQSESETVGASEVLFNKRYDLTDEVLRFEHDLIGRTLASVNGIHTQQNYSDLAIKPSRT